MSQNQLQKKSKKCRKLRMSQTWIIRHLFALVDYWVANDTNKQPIRRSFCVTDVNGSKNCEFMAIWCKFLLFCLLSLSVCNQHRLYNTINCPDKCLATSTDNSGSIDTKPVWFLNFVFHHVTSSINTIFFACLHDLKVENANQKISMRFHSYEKRMCFGW